MLTMKKYVVLIASAMTIIVTGCGGGGGGGGGDGGGGSSASASNSASSVPVASSLSGVAAVGTPIVNADVHLVCATGNAPTPVKTNAAGSWLVALNGQGFPCAVKVSGGTVNGSSNTNVYHSVAVAATTVNVTPLTDLLVANMVGTASPSTWFLTLSSGTNSLATVTQTQLDRALANLNAAFPTLPVYGAGNHPITSVFNPTAGNSHDDMLSALQTAMRSAGVTYASLLSSASTTPFIAPRALGPALSTAYHATSSGSTAVYFPVDSAISMLEASGMTITMTGRYNGNAISVTQTSTPLSGGQSFDGQPALASNFGGSTTYLGSTTQLSTSTSYYNVGPYKQLGETGANGHTVYANQIPLPGIATIGSSGSLDTGTEYTDATRATVVDTFVENWSLRAGATAGTANLCINIITQLASATAVPTTTTTCVTIDAAGNILQLQSVGSIVGETVTLTSTSITTPPPKVVSTVPAWGATGVGSAAPITLTFNKPVEPSTITNSTFTLFAGSTPVAGTVSVTGATATFTPTAPLASNTFYTATVSGGVKDLSGNFLGSAYDWTFQTRTMTSIVATSPTPYSYPFALNGVVTATFSSALDASTVNANNFTLSGPSGPIPGTVGYSGLTASFTPSALLTVNTVYRASITSGVKDLFGDAIAAGQSWTFQTFAPGTATTPQPFTPIPPGLWQPPSGATPSAGNYVYLQSDAGDYVGQGQTYTYTPLNAQLTFSAITSGVGVSIQGNTWWSGEFVGPTTLSQVQVGYYSGLIRWPFHNPVLGGVSWSGDGRGCNMLLGWFAVDNVTYTNGVLSGVDLRFEQQCEGGQAALHGALHWGP
jgi:Bacterial Ig-like domain